MSTTNFLSVLNVPRPLTYWAGQGGVYVGIKATPKGDLFHLIAAIGKHILKPQAWGPNKIKGASSYFDGFANTNSMAKGGSRACQAGPCARHRWSQGLVYPKPG